jgi:hypothetical protein
MSSIVWLASYPKSGNTWVRAFFAALGNSGDKFSLADLGNSSTQCVSKGWNVGVLGEQPVYADIPSALADRPRLLQALASHVSARQRPYFLVKTHSTAGRFHGAEMIPPGLARRAVLIVRNPFDVCISACNHFGIDIERSVRLMQNAHATMGEVAPDLPRHPLLLTSWASHTVSWLARTDMDVRLVRYEDLYLFPLREFAALATDVAEIHDEVRVLKAIIDSDFDKLKQEEQEKGFKEASQKAERFFLGGKVGAGLEKLSAEQRDRLYTPWKRLINALGYRYDGNGLSVRPVDRPALDALVAEFRQRFGRKPESAARA